MAPTLLVLRRRITTALKQLRLARCSGNAADEFAWQVRMDCLLDRYPRTPQ